MDREPVKLLQARLTLWIEVERADGPHWQDYDLRKLNPHPTIGSPAYQLMKPDGEVYDVILKGRHGAECDCPDFVMARQHKDGNGCKHCIALRDVGLLPEVK